VQQYTENTQTSALVMLLQPIDFTAEFAHIEGLAADQMFS